MSTIDEIKARVDIVELVSETVELRRSGRNYTGFWSAMRVVMSLNS